MEDVDRIEAAKKAGILPEPVQIGTPGSQDPSGPHGEGNKRQPAQEPQAEPVPAPEVEAEAPAAEEVPAETETKSEAETTEITADPVADADPAAPTEGE